MRFYKREGKRQLGALVMLAVIVGAVACADNAPKTAGSAPLKSTGNDSVAATGQLPTGTAAVGATPARVVIMGTSLTAGLGLDPSEAYPALLQKLADSLHFKVTIVGAGLSGETSAGALRRAGWVLEQPAAAVILEVGANDGLRGVDPDSTRANIEALVDSIHKKQPKAVVQLVQMEAPPNFGSDYTTRFHNAYKKAAADKGIVLLPFLLNNVAGVAELNQNDGVHPNKQGSPIVARNMLDALTPLFKTLSPPSN
jgi:acyl-CoA thioesterase-1